MPETSKTGTETGMYTWNQTSLDMAERAIWDLVTMPSLCDMSGSTVLSCFVKDCQGLSLTLHDGRQDGHEEQEQDGWNNTCTRTAASACNHYTACMPASPDLEQCLVRWAPRSLGPLLAPQV